MIPFPDFAPDRSSYALDASPAIENVLPVADGWGPLPDLEEITSALASRCLGATSVRDLSGTWATYAGTSANLYKLDTTDYGWDDVTRLSGGDYNVQPGDRWTLTQVSDTLVAHQINDDIQYIDLVSGTNFAALPGSPPKAKYSCMMGESLLLGNIENLPNAIQCSAYGDIEAWERGVGGASRQILPDGGEVSGVFPIENGAIVFQRNKIRLASSSFDAAGFSVTTVNAARGAISPLSICPIGRNRYFYLSEDGFYIFDGQNDEPVGAERVDRWFLGGDSTNLVSEVDKDKLNEVRSFLDPYRKVVFVQYVKQDGSYGLLGLNYLLTGADNRPGRWFQVDNNVEEIVTLATAGITLGGADTLGYTTLADAIDIPVGARVFQGGKPTIGAFTTDHKLALFTGQNRAATLETPTVQLSPGYRSLLQEVALVGDFDSEDVTIQVGTADRRGVALTWGSAVSCEADESGLFKTLDDGRYHRLRANIPAGTTWESLTGVDDQESRFVRTGRT